MIILIFPIYLIIVALFVSAFWYPVVAASIFLISSLIFEAFLFWMNRIKSELDSDKKWSNNEKEIIQKHSLYFRLLRLPRLFSYVLSAIQLSVFLWVPLLLYEGHWLLAVIIGLNYFISGPLSAKLDPVFFLRDAVKRGKLEFSQELDSINNVDKKLNNTDTQNAPEKSRGINTRLFVVLVEFAKISRENFLKSYQYEESVFGNAAMFESLAYSFFIIYHLLVAKKFNLDIRDKFYAYARNEIINASKGLLNTDIADLLDYRLKGYGDMATSGSKNWLESIHNRYIINLEGVENKNNVEKGYPIKGTGLTEEFPKHSSFIRKEIILLNGLDDMVSDIIKEQKIN